MRHDFFLLESTIENPLLPLLIYSETGLKIQVNKSKFFNTRQRSLTYGC